MELTISPKKIMKILTILVMILMFASITGQIYKYYGGHDRYLVSLFDLDKEWNIPTWYASTSLLFCSFLLLIISLGEKNKGSSFYYHWAILSVIFLFLALDEAIQFHEKTNTPLRNLLDADGFFYYSWVIPAAILLVVFLLAFFKFIIRLPSMTRLLFIISGALFVGGGLGMEFIGGHYVASHGVDNLTYAILTNIEESLEMAGILVFIYALMRFISIEFKNVQIDLPKRNLLHQTVIRLELR